ncbi:hypothetical protein R3W88_011121 [Solanum pinnatisectum]|uniref:Uncharacterized protein n=1 Tax=Solanum pinnatisectum TaxID=50273 RepID=A0AAV9L5Y1_9SOLN|nr:hypothetical protein R3W88_011121 [Solanum pinnatisectum]
MDYTSVRALYLAKMLPFDLPHSFISNTPFHFFFYDIIYLKCLHLRVKKILWGAKERALSSRHDCRVDRHLRNTISRPLTLGLSFIIDKYDSTCQLRFLF